MSISGFVHWHEGQFLRPHHFQTLQRRLFEEKISERSLAWPFPYGVVESVLSEDDLVNGVVRFERLRVIMPSGIDIDMPGNTDLLALDVSDEFESRSEGFVVSLGVPYWDALRANLAGDQEQSRQLKRFYYLEETDRPDENTGENPQRIVLRRLNARLFVGETDPGIEAIPLVRIVRDLEQLDRPRRDANFAPPCLVVRGDASLSAVVQRIANEVESEWRTTARRMRDESFGIRTIRGKQFEQLFRLRTLSRFASQLPMLARAPRVSTFDMYLMFRELLGELSALYPSAFDELIPIDYDHDRPMLSFSDAAAKIQKALHRRPTSEIERLEFKREDGVLVAPTTPEQLERATEFYLSVESRRDSREVVALVEDSVKFKLMSRKFAARRVKVPGVKLEWSPQHPDELPSRSGVNYFRLLRSENDMWNYIVDDKAFGVHCTEDEAEDFQLSLYMLLPEEKGT